MLIVPIYKIVNDKAYQTIHQYNKQISDLLSRVGVSESDVKFNTGFNIIKGFIIPNPTQVNSAVFLIKLLEKKKLIQLYSFFNLNTNELVKDNTDLNTFLILKQYYESMTDSMTYLSIHQRTLKGNKPFQTTVKDEKTSTIILAGFNLYNVLQLNKSRVYHFTPILFSDSIKKPVLTGDEHDFPTIHLPYSEKVESSQTTVLSDGKHIRFLPSVVEDYDEYTSFLKVTPFLYSWVLDSTRFDKGKVKDLDVENVRQKIKQLKMPETLKLYLFPDEYVNKNFIPLHIGKKAGRGLHYCQLTSNCEPNIAWFVNNIQIHKDITLTKYPEYINLMKFMKKLLYSDDNDNNKYLMTNPLKVTEGSKVKVGKLITVNIHGHTLPLLMDFKITFHKLGKRIVSDYSVFIHNIGLQLLAVKVYLDYINKKVPKNVYNIFEVTARDDELILYDDLFLVSVESNGDGITTQIELNEDRDTIIIPGKWKEFPIEFKLDGGGD